MLRMEAEWVAGDAALRDDRLRVAALKQRVYLDICCIDAAAGFVRDGDAEFLKFNPPALDRPVSLFVATAKPLVDLATKYESVLVEAGLHPRKLEDARATIEELIHAHEEWCSNDRLHTAAPIIARGLADRVRGRFKQLRLELLPALDEGDRARWKAVASLGRTHRPQLMAAPNTKLLTAGSDQPRKDTKAITATAEEVTPPPAGVRRIARRIALRIAGGTTDTEVGRGRKRATANVKLLASGGDDAEGDGTTS